MAINKYMQAALRALSNVDVNIKKNYNKIRRLERMVKKPRIKLNYRTWNHILRNKEHKILLRLFSPVNKKIENFAAAKYPVIIFLHGGGWVTGDLESYEKCCLTMARQTGHVIIAVDYRLAPEYPFPAALQDCRKAVRTIMRWLKVSGSPYPVTLAGDSAGGNLAAALSLYMRDRGEKTVDRQILIYPATYNNHTESSPFGSVSENGTGYILTAKHICDYMDLYCPKEEDRGNQYLAPLLAFDFSNQPDTLIITAQFDPLRDEGEEYGRKLKEAGNSVTVRRIDNALHGYFTLPATFSAVKESYELINQFLRKT
ncbi:MAG: alpha/beta hydrolase [Oscillospiraceae bacterium]|jgi:acetyl esterase/lipase|nr:alpha/beta hydrolase [Oscillospiraceae bacterium]